VQEKKSRPTSATSENGSSEEAQDNSAPALPEEDAETPENDSESVQILHGVAGLLAAPEIGPESDEEIEARLDLNHVVHRMLIVGLVLSTITLFAGLALSAVSHRPLPLSVSGFRQLFSGLKTGSPSSILSLGILLLIATPVLRVLGSLVEFLGKRDWRYATITFVVLVILAISVLAGSG
jgi:uncharacterized membrane protein